MTDIHGLASNALLAYIELLCYIRGLEIADIARMAGKRTGDFTDSLAAGSINARIRYIPFVVAALDLSHAEACAAYEYAGVGPLRAFTEISSVMCYIELRAVISAYDGLENDVEYEKDINAVLQKYGLPLITLIQLA